MEKDDDY